jgi:hypothetical protein
LGKKNRSEAKRKRPVTAFQVRRSVRFFPVSPPPKLHTACSESPKDVALAFFFFFLRKKVCVVWTEPDETRELFLFRFIVCLSKFRGSGRERAYKHTL